MVQGPSSYISYEYPLYILASRPLLPYLDIITQGLKERNIDPIFIFFGLSRSVYYLLHNIKAMDLKYNLIANIKKNKDINEIIDEIMGNYDAPGILPCIIVSQENIWKKIHPRKITNEFRNNLEKEGEFAKSLLDLITRKGLNAYIWRVSLKRGQTFGIWNIPLVNVKERTRTLIWDISRGLANGNNLKLENILKQFVFIIVLENPYDAISTFEAILSAITALNKEMNHENNPIIPPILFGLPGIGLLRNKEIINRIIGVARRFIRIPEPRIDEPEGYIENAIGFPPLLSDGIIDIEKEIVEVVSGHYDALREDRSSLHLFLCLKDLPGVLWDITLKLAGMEGLKETIREIYQANENTEYVEFIPNLSNVRIRHCSYRPFISGAPIKDQIVGCNFAIETAVELLNVSNRDLILNKFLSNSKYLLNYWGKMLNGEDNITIDTVVNNTFLAVRDQRMHKIHKCPNEIICPVATKLTSSQCNSSNRSIFEQFIKASGKNTIRAIVNICATGWERPGTIAFTLTVLSICGILDENKLNNNDNVNRIIQSINYINENINETNLWISALRDICPNLGNFSINYQEFLSHPQEKVQQLISLLKPKESPPQPFGELVEWLRQYIKWFTDAQSPPPDPKKWSSRVEDLRRRLEDLLKELRDICPNLRNFSINYQEFLSHPQEKVQQLISLLEPKAPFLRLFGELVEWLRQYIKWFTDAQSPPPDPKKWSSRVEDLRRRLEDLLIDLKRLLFQEQCNVRYLASSSCINPANTLLEILAIREMENQNIVPPIIRSILILPINGKNGGNHDKNEGILEEYADRIVKFLNEFYTSLLIWPHSSSDFKLYEKRKIYGGILISNKYIGLCDIIHCKMGKRSYKVLLGPIYYIIQEILSKNKNNNTQELPSDLLQKLERLTGIPEGEKKVLPDKLLQELIDFMRFLCNESRRERNAERTNEKINEKINSMYGLLEELNKLTDNLTERLNGLENEPFLKETANIMLYILSPIKSGFGKIKNKNKKFLKLKKNFEYFSRVKNLNDYEIMKKIANYLKRRGRLNEGDIEKLLRLEFILTAIADKMHLSIASTLTERWGYPFREYALFERGVMNKIGW
ncbi:MAG: hypothetical protein ACP6IQ_05555 [Candidatus Njordarchaeia archaeon]